MIHIDAHRPIADGIQFDDLIGLPIDACNLLAARGVVFCTEFEANGSRYGGRIVATSWKAAEDIAFGRGLGEEVVGVLCQVGEIPE